MKISKKAIGLLLIAGALGMSACDGGIASNNGGNNNGGNNYGEKQPDKSDPGKDPTSSGNGSTVAKISEAARKAFSKISGLSDFSANIQNAASLGLSKKSSSARQMRKRLNDDEDGEFETTQTLVKTTTNYEAGEANVAENGELNVTFTKIDTTVKSTHVQGQKNLFASLKDGVNNEVIVDEYGENTITFKSDNKHEYRVVDRDGKVVQDWSLGKTDKTTTQTLEVKKNKSISNYKVYIREEWHNSNQGNQNNDGWWENNYLDDISQGYWDGGVYDDGYFFWAQKDRNDVGMEYETHYYYEYRVLDITDPKNKVTLIDWTSYHPQDEELADSWESVRVPLDLDALNVTNPSKIKVQRRERSEQVYYNEQQQNNNNNNEWVYRNGRDLDTGIPGKVSFWADGKYVDQNNEDNYADRYYCLKDETGAIVCDWVKHETSGTLSFDIDYVNPVTTRDYAVEARSVDAIVTYPAYEGFAYTLLDKDGNVLFNNITASNPANVSTDDSLIVFDGLKEGEKYVLKYEGYGEETTTEQSKVGGEIDKMYVYNEQFTFVSFVPYGASLRPVDELLKYEEDGIATYDRTGYFTNSERQSFIFDNYSGYIYLIEGINIKYIYNNLLINAADNGIYDFHVDEENNLVIENLLPNKTIKALDFFKDKYGNKVIHTDKLNDYSAETNTYFYAARPNYNSLLRIISCGEYTNYGKLRQKADDLSRSGNYEEAEKIWSVTRQAEQYMNYNDNVNDLYKRYYLTNDNETLFIEYDSKESWRRIKDQYLIVDHSNHRELTFQDDFYAVTEADEFLTTVRVTQSYIMSFVNQEYYNDYLYARNWNQTYYKNFVTGDFVRVEYNYDSPLWFNYSYVNNYDILLIFDKTAEKLYSYKFDDIASHAYQSYRNYNYYGDGNYDENYKNDLYVTEYAIRYSDFAECVQENISINDDYSSFLTYGVSGNVNYDMVLEEVNGEMVVKSYVSGTYEAPQVKIILQPINRQFLLDCKTQL